MLPWRLSWPKHDQCTDMLQKLITDLSEVLQTVKGHGFFVNKITTPIMWLDQVGRSRPQDWKILYCWTIWPSCQKQLINCRSLPTPFYKRFVERLNCPMYGNWVLACYQLILWCRNLKIKPICNKAWLSNVFANILSVYLDPKQLTQIKC